MNERCKILVTLSLKNQNNLLQDQKTLKTKRAYPLPITRTLKVQVAATVQAVQVSPAPQV